MLKHSNLKTKNNTDTFVSALFYCCSRL